jgi:predicted phage terminase large subunit-like protein
VSRGLPAYVLGRNPDANIIACSYSADLASSMNRDVQKKIDSPEYAAVFPDTKLNSANIRSFAKGQIYLRNSDVFEIVGHSGKYRSAGVGGGITGQGISEDGIGIIDDPIKNREEAESETYREKVWNWYESTFYTRIEGNAPMLFTCTRWNEDDLAGRLIRKAKEDPDAEQWEVISLPALSEEERPAYDQRAGPDIPLWIDKFNFEWLKKRQATVSAYTWLSMFQQRPSSAKGNLFKMEKMHYFYDNPSTYELVSKNGSIHISKHSCIKFQTCDPAGTAKTQSDNFVLATWVLTQQGHLLLVDLFKTKLEGPDHVKFITEQYRLHNPICLGFESISIGLTTFQNLQRAGFNIVDLQPKGDKFTRALSAAIRLGEETVYFKWGAPWLEEFKTELLHFPNVKHDDSTDCFSYAHFMISSGIVQNYDYVEQATAVKVGEDYTVSDYTLEDTGSEW